MRFAYKIIGHLIAMIISGIIVAAIVWTAVINANPNSSGLALNLAIIGFALGAMAWVFIYATARSRTA